MNVPLVDLRWQHAEIVDEVTSGLEAVMANTAFIQAAGCRVRTGIRRIL